MSDPHPGPTGSKPVDPPMVPFALAGIATWAAAGLVILVADGPSGWLRICLAGFLLGFPGLAVMVVHDRNRRLRRRGEPTG